MSSETGHTFIFADLAGFTAFTEAHGDERAADLAMEFCRAINRRLPSGAQDLKMIGDSCLLRVADAADAVTLGLSLTTELAAQHGLLDVRIGMNTGTAVRRGDEWFGTAINIAARVAALAGPREVLLTEASREAAGLVSNTLFTAVGPRRLRNIAAPVRLYRASSNPAMTSEGSITQRSTLLARASQRRA